MSIRDAVIVSTARTPIGKAYKGAFNATPSPTLAAHAIRAAVERAGIAPGEVDDVIIGAAMQQGVQATIGRTAALRAGSRVRGRFILDAVDEKAPGQLLMRHSVTVEIENQPKPALTAQWLGLIFT